MTNERYRWIVARLRRMRAEQLHDPYVIAAANAGAADTRIHTTRTLTVTQNDPADTETADDLPRVWQAGDPEPERPVKFRDRNGVYDECDGEGSYGAHGEAWGDIAVPVTEVLPEESD